MNLLFADSIYGSDSVLKRCHACLVQLGCHKPVVINCLKHFKNEAVLEQHFVEDGVDANLIQIRSVHAKAVFHKQRKECSRSVALAYALFGHTHMHAHTHTQTNIPKGSEGGKKFVLRCFFVLGFV